MHSIYFDFIFLILDALNVASSLHKWVTCIATKSNMKDTSVRKSSVEWSSKSGPFSENMWHRSINAVKQNLYYWNSRKINLFHHIISVFASLQCTSVLTVSANSDRVHTWEITCKRTPSIEKCMYVRMTAATGGTLSYATWNRTWRRTTATGTRSSAIVKAAIGSSQAK